MVCGIEKGVSWACANQALIPRLTIQLIRILNASRTIIERDNPRTLAVEQIIYNFARLMGATRRSIVKERE